MKVVILCIGNRLGGDDGIGPYIADHLPSANNRWIIDCGVAPENYTSIVRQQKPDLVILIDAVDMHLPPGSIRNIPADHIGTMHISTHNIPLSVLIKYLKTFTNDVLLIGIQPETMNGSLTLTLKKSGDKLIKIIDQMNISKIQHLS
ncbi:MAG: hydrogenase maturation peptidase HycI [Candidatus Thermoplasmatota archaeon]|nr:hydrogenase maturation peptidase HycI [Candidatus Thermoplasmatota archaeon]MBU1941012.1 hydrogenase maturation peptidase HycI [Candidatus Thermoplasmatota archaeon]